MKNPKGLIVTIILIAAPIAWLFFRLNAIEKSVNISGDQYQITEDQINDIINEQMSNAGVTEDETPTVSNNSGESQSSIYGNPISKVIEGAKIIVSSANIYQEPDDSSSLVASVYKDTIVTVQDYENGWSNIKAGDLAGWIKTEFVSKPEDGSLTEELTTAVGHKGTINVQNELRVRASAPANSKGQATAEIIDTLKKGDEVNIIGANDDESWYQIQYGTKSGWIIAEYVKIVK